MKKLLFLILFIFLSPLLSAEEKILNYKVSFSLNANAYAKITEEITVNAEHNKIKRGIYRIIPFQSYQEVKVWEVEMDGYAIPSALHYNDNYSIRIDFGDDSYIPKGEHTYKLVYTITNAVKPFLKYDEIYWNVTGNDWDFPIDKAEFSLALPKQVEIIQEGISFYTGSYGSSGKNAALIQNYNNAVNIKTTKPLEPQEGFTVAIPFKKGFIELTPKEQILLYLRFYAPIVLFTILMLYCLITWFLYGKDPKADGRVLFAPPEGLSPAFVRFICYRYTDNTTFSASLVNLAIKKKIQIKSKGSTVHIDRKSTSTEGLSLEEQYIMDKLFTTKDSVILGQKYSKKLKDIFEKSTSLVAGKGKPSIRRNSKFVLFPFILLVLMQFTFPWYVIFTNFIIMIISFILLSLSRSFVVILTAVILTIFHNGIGLNETLTIISLLTFLIYAATISNTSLKGRKIYLDVLAFEKYMKSAEKHRAQLSTPEDSAKLFADFLPYAYAFDMQSEWIDSFSKILSKNLIEQQTQDLGGTRIIQKDLLSSALNNSIREPSASRNSGGSRSSGGSFGGGFSGGGFGGGGGGGR